MRLKAFSSITADMKELKSSGWFGGREGWMVGGGNGGEER